MPICYSSNFFELLDVECISFDPNFVRPARASRPNPWQPCSEVKACQSATLQISSNSWMLNVFPLTPISYVQLEQDARIYGIPVLRSKHANLLLFKFHRTPGC